MSRSSVNVLIIWLLAIVSVAALILNIPDGAIISQYALQAIVYAVVTAFTLYFAVLLPDGELSPAHTVGIAAFLSLPKEAQPLMTWAIFAGGLVGGLMLAARGEDTQLRRRLTTRTIYSVIILTARITLSFVVAGAVYTLLGGDLPLSSPIRDQFVPLLAFSAAYCVVYVAIFLLETYNDYRSVRRMFNQSLWLIVAIVVLPVPFGILSALVIGIAPTSLLLFAGGVILVSLGLNGLSRAQYRLRKQIGELRSLSVVSQALQSNLKLTSLLNTVYLQVVELLNINDFVVALYDPETHELEFPLAIRGGEQATLAETNPGKTLLHHVLQTSTPLLISQDVTQRAKALGLEPPTAVIYSWLGVPLMAGGKLLGAMAVLSDNPQHTFSADDLRLLNIVAANASIAIDNAQLYEQQTMRVSQLSTLNRVLSLLTGTLSPDDVLDAVLSSATVISEATAAAVYLYWNEGALTLVRSAGFSDSFTADPPTPLLTKSRQKPILVNSVNNDVTNEALRAIMRRENKAAWVEMPLSVADISLGVIVFYFDTTQMFNDESVEILRAFANQAAQAIKNARLYTSTDEALEARVEQMYALATLGRQLTATMNLRSICNLVLSRALELCRANTGLIIVREGTEWVIPAQSGYPLLMNITPALIQQSVVGQVLQNGQSVRYGDARTEAKYPSLMGTTRSQLTVPILRSGETLGAISLESDRVGAFSEEDSYFVTQLANQTMIALDNTRLFERIAEARDRLQVILNAMTEAIVLIERTGNIALANPRVDLIGLDSRQLLDKNVDDLLENPELDLAERMGFQSDQKVRKLVKEMRAPGQWVGIEPASYTHESDHGLLYVQRHVIPIRGEDGEPIGMLFVFYNETEQHELNQMREDLSSMIVHDLRSPLTAVTTGLKLLREVIPLDSEFRGIVESTTETSQRAIRKLLSRVNSLLDISKMQNGQLNLDTEPTELATLADSVCMELSPLAHELDVVLTSQVSDGLPLLNIDADKIERVLQNLVDNALKFCPADGSVTIRTHMMGLDGAASQFVRVDVADTGPGIPDEYKSRLFERYVQIKGRRGARRGIGLGLTFCKLTIEGHGGRIWIEDNPGGGSIFAFTLPVSTTTRFDETGEHPAVNKQPPGT